MSASKPQSTDGGGGHRDEVRAVSITSRREGDPVGRCQAHRAGSRRFRSPPVRVAIRCADERFAY